MYQAIGEATVAASSLEAQLVFLVAIARGHDDAWVRQRLGKPAGQVRPLLRDLVGDVEPGPFREQLRRLLGDADAVLDGRNRLVHSVAMLDHGEDGELLLSFWHPGSDTEAAISPAQILEHAHDLGALASRTLALGHQALAWHQHQTAPEA